MAKISKRQQSFHGSHVEPSIGDFGLVDTQDPFLPSPRHRLSFTMAIKDPKELEDIVKGKSVLFNE